MKSLRRAERSRKRRKERERKRARFISNPFQFTSILLGNKTSGRLVCSREEVGEHLEKVHSDKHQNEELDDNDRLIHPEEPQEVFDMEEPRLEEVKDVVKRSRAGSAPGPNGLPYKVYKNCPRLTKRLWKYFRVIWRKGKLVDSWFRAERCFIPKEENSKSLGQLRTISLLNVECKIFLSVLVRRMTTYLLDNKYIDISVQKGGVSGV